MTVYDALDTAERNLGSIAFLNGRLSEGVSLISGSNVTVYHGLKRVPRGWLVTRAITSAASLYEVFRSDTTIVLRAGNTGTADIWVF